MNTSNNKFVQHLKQKLDEFSYEEEGEQEYEEEE